MRFEFMHNITHINKREFFFIFPLYKREIQLLQTLILKNYFGVLMHSSMI